MFDYAILALTIVGSGAALIFAATIVILAATPEANEERPPRFASRAMARLWRSARAATASARAMNRSRRSGSSVSQTFIADRLGASVSGRSYWKQLKDFLADHSPKRWLGPMR